MDQAPLIVSVVAVVLGGVGLIGGVIGYVQGTTAVARATNARQRAVVAEAEALQARAAAEAAARSAEDLVERARASSPVPSPDSAPRQAPAGPAVEASSPGPRETGSTRLPQPAGTGPVVVPIERQPAEHFEIPVPAPAPAEGESGRDVPDSRIDPQDSPEPTGTELLVGARPVRSGTGAAAPAGPGAPAVPPGAEEPPTSSATTADPPSGSGEQQEREPEPVLETAVDDGVEDAQPAGSTAEPSEDVPPAESDRDAPRDDRGRVAAGAQDAPTMDWAEVLRTGAIPLPSRSRGTYAAPRRRPRPTGDGPARFELRAIGRQRFEAVNVGGEQAEEARIEGSGDDPHLIRPLSARPSTVQPAGTLAFSVLRVEGRHAAVAVTWTREGEAVRQELPLD